MRYLFALQPEKLLSRSQANEVNPIPDSARVKKNIHSQNLFILHVAPASENENTEWFRGQLIVLPITVMSNFSLRTRCCRNE